MLSEIEPWRAQFSVENKSLSTTLDVQSHLLIISQTLILNNPWSEKTHIKANLAARK